MKGSNLSWSLLCQHSLKKEKIYSLHWLQDDEILVCQDKGKLFICKLQESDGRNILQVTIRDVPDSTISSDILLIIITRTGLYTLKISSFPYI